MTVRNIICMKWGTKYGPEYVNTLHSIVDRHLSGAFRFICLTDDETGIDERIECFPIPNLDIEEGPERGWKKLNVFRTGLWDLHGPTLFLDLDVVITDSIDALFEHPGEFLIIHDWAKGSRDIGNSSVFRFEAGMHQDVIDRFERDHQSIRNQVRNEQEYLTRAVENKSGFGFWPSEWCVSFKYQCMAKFPMTFFKDPILPSQAKVIAFHGHPTPPEAIKGVSRKWTRWVRPTKWVADHWR